MLLPYTTYSQIVMPWDQASAVGCVGFLNSKFSDLPDECDCCYTGYGQNVSSLSPPVVTFMSLRLGIMPGTYDASGKSIL